MDEATTKAAEAAFKHLVAEYRSQLLEARGHAVVLARQLSECSATAAALAMELEATRRELARKDERIAELEQQAELGAWRERLGAL